MVSSFAFVIFCWQGYYNTHIERNQYFFAHFERFYVFNKVLGDFMLEIDRIEQMAAEHGKSLSFISVKLGHGRGYLKDKKLHNSVIDENTLAQIAGLLNTTTDYLHGKTDKKEKPGIVAELSERDIRILNIIRKLPDDVLDALELDLYRKGLL